MCFPAGQSTQWRFRPLAPSSTKCAVSEWRTASVCENTVYLPDGQSSCCCLLAVVEATFVGAAVVAAPTAMQLMLPKSVLYRPGAQLRQKDLPAFSWNLPTGHKKQKVPCVLRCGVYLPAAHSLHECWRGLAWKRPPGQRAQAPSEAAVSPTLYRPAAHGLCESHDKAPAALRKFRHQAAQ